MFSHSLMQISDQTITLQQVSEIWHLEVLKFNLSIRMQKKGDLSVFECGVAVGARGAGLSNLETADLLVFSHINNCRFL